MADLGYATDMQGKLIAAARGLLGINQTELAERAGISRKTVLALEQDTGNPTRASERAVVEALESAGVHFEESPGRIGVWLARKPTQKV